MKHKLTGLFLIIGTVLASSCGTAGQYAEAGYDDDIYYRPTPESRSIMVAQAKAEAEKRNESYADEYVATDSDGRMWLITENNDGTYASRLHRFDNPYYSFNFNFGVWGDPRYNPWWGPWRFYPGYYYDYWYYRWTDPWYWNDPWFWGDPWYWNRPWFWGDPWYGPHYYHGWDYYYWNRHYTPGPGTVVHHNAVYTPRTSSNSGIMRSGGSAIRTGSSSGSSAKTTRRVSNTNSGSRSGVVRTTNSQRNSSISRSSSNSQGYSGSSRTQSGGSYSGGYSGGSRTGGGAPSYQGSGTHTGGGRR